MTFESAHEPIVLFVGPATALDIPDQNGEYAVEMLRPGLPLRDNDASHDHGWVKGRTKRNPGKTM